MTSPRTTEEEAFNLKSGAGTGQISHEERHFFDIAGYLVLENVLDASRLIEARDAIDRIVASPTNGINGPATGRYGRELLNVIESGGVIEDAMAIPRVLPYVEQFVWGRQHRLVGSRAILRSPGEAVPLNQGGAADPRRHARYRCCGNGQFRCLMTTCLIAMDDTGTDNGEFCAIPASHKSNLPHPYAKMKLRDIAPLESIPLPAGSAVFITENLAHAFCPPAGGSQTWLAYHYGPSYMMNLPGCNPSGKTLERTAADPIKAHLLLKPYYHPTTAQRKANG